MLKPRTEHHLSRPNFKLFLQIILVVTCCEALANSRPVILASSISHLVPNPTIMSVFEDSHGFLWIGTQQGLFMFDGADMVPFSRARDAMGDLPVSDVRGIFEDSLGKLVVATFGGGIYRLDRDSSSFESVSFVGSDELKYVNRVLQLDGEIFLLISNDEIAFLDSNLKRMTQASNRIQELGGPDYFVGAALTSNKDLLLGMESGIYILKNSQGQAENVYSAPTNSKITAFYGAPNQRMYLTTSRNTLEEFDLKSRSIVNKLRLGNTLFSNITNIAIHSGFIWIGTDQGLIHVDSNFERAVLNDKTTSQLFSDHILTLYSTEQILWAGTYSGLNTISRTAFHTFTSEDRVPISDVLSFTELDDGRMLVGTYEGLYIKAKNSQEHQKVTFSVGKDIGELPIMALSQKNGQVWIGLWKLGVYVWDTTKDTITPAPLPANTNLAVTSILHDDKGFVWIATYNKGVFRVNPNGQEVRNYLPDTPAIKVLQRDTKTVLVVSTKEIHAYHQIKDQFAAKKITFGVDDVTMFITSIHENIDGDLLVGTKDSGLFIWKERMKKSGESPREELLSFDSTSLLTINGLEEDSDGEVWCTTQNGIVRIGKTGEFIASFSKAHGLQGDDFNSGASFMDKSGNIYFGGPHGYTSFHPNDVIAQSSESPIFIASMQTFGTESRTSYSLAGLDKLVLTHNSYLVKLSFSLKDFVDPDKHQYRYKLEGFDPDWIDNGNRNTATYTSLPPGDYVFRVIGANSAGIWNEDGIELAVTVLPPPWLSWWAYCCYAIALLGLVWTGKKFYDTYAVKEKAVKMAADMVATAHRVEDELQYQQEFQDEMVQEVYRHNLETLELLRQSVSAVTALEGKTEAEQSSRLQRQLDVLTLLEENYYCRPEGLLADLNQFTDALISRLLTRASAPVESITTINKVPDTLLPANIASPIALVLAELLENSLLHAFDANSAANYIEVELVNTEIEDAGPCYCLTVSDTGRGLPPNLIPESANTPGLTMIRDLATHVNGAFTLSSDRGCVATFSIPRDQAAS